MPPRPPPQEVRCPHSGPVGIGRVRFRLVEHRGREPASRRTARVSARVVGTLSLIRRSVGPARAALPLLSQSGDRTERGVESPLKSRTYVRVFELGPQPRRSPTWARRRFRRGRVEWRADSAGSQRALLAHRHEVTFATYAGKWHHVLVGTMVRRRYSEISRGRMMATAKLGGLEELRRLGFSQYEAQAYVGLLASEEAQTGYSLAKLTGMPQAKVYETLGRLVRHGAAIQTSAEPARYVAAPAEQFLSKVADQFNVHIDQAREALHRSEGPAAATEWPHVAWRLDAQQEILDRAVEAVLSARDKVYISVKTPELGRLVDAVHDASMRGIDFVVLHFGPNPFPDLRGATYQHLSTEGNLYPRHQAQHIAVVSDTERCLWGLALDGREWNAITADDATMARAIKSYIRHDIYVQRIFGDFRNELTDRYGPALERLSDLTERTAGERSTADRRRVS